MEMLIFPKRLLQVVKHIEYLFTIIIFPIQNNYDITISLHRHRNTDLSTEITSVVLSLQIFLDLAQNMQAQFSPDQTFRPKVFCATNIGSKYLHPFHITAVKRKFPRCCLLNVTFLTSSSIGLNVAYHKYWHNRNLLTCLTIESYIIWIFI